MSNALKEIILLTHFILFTCFFIHMIPEPHPVSIYWNSNFVQWWRKMHDCVHQQPVGQRKFNEIQASHRKGKERARAESYSSNLDLEFNNFTKWFKDIEQQDWLSVIVIHYNINGTLIPQTWIWLWTHYHSCPYQKPPVNFHCPEKTGYVFSANLQRKYGIFLNFSQGRK